MSDNLIRQRKEGYLDFCRMALRYPTDRSRKHRNLDRKILIHAGKGNIPWRNPKGHKKEMTPDEFEENMALTKEEWKESGYDKYRPIHSDYFYTCFLGQAPELILLDENELQDKLEEIREREMPRSLPQDGSRGQWKAAKNIDIATVRWFLGEWHGDLPEQANPQ